MLSPSASSATASPTTSSRGTGNTTPTMSKTDSSTLYIPPHLRSQSNDFDDHHTERIPSVSSDMDEDQQQHFYYYHHRSSMDTSGHTTTHSQPPIIKNKQQIIDYMNQHKITQILKTKLNEAFQHQSVDPIEYVFRTKRVEQQEMLIQQRQHQMKEMDIKHDEVLSSIQQSKESMKSEYEKLEKEHLQEISKLKLEIEELKKRAQELDNEPQSDESNILEQQLESLRKENEDLENENQALLKRNKDLTNILHNTSSSLASSSVALAESTSNHSPSSIFPEEITVGESSMEDTTIEVNSQENIENVAVTEDDSADPFASLDNQQKEEQEPQQ
ncbi:hypothetical protein FDP41_002222 [Naegleria fowleri]|uniref:Uncharacterized protein n=1 Tax=Naegleria fowleri TaxID=5763 RepID=A0A6A5BUL2_NAEFO|nr:uncharacterized protein FDP41_002222 [Naegleria fowleri]KAF0978402.1 hypothetical protein FDP41_002222 [Naegleria fowleri]CAG4714720.1 unnamed protein product [Naegleria fowleri]